MELLSYTDAAKLLGVHRNTVHDMVKDGKLEKVVLLRTPKIRRSEIEAILNGTKAVESAEGK